MAIQGVGRGKGVTHSKSYENLIIVQTLVLKNKSQGFSGCSVVKESACQCRRHRFNPWSGRIPYAKEQVSPRATTIGPVLWGPGTAATEPTSSKH